MDQNLQDYPILSFVLYQISPTSHPSLPHESLQNLITRFPHLQNPKVISALSNSIPSTVAQTQSLLNSLGLRPDPSAVESARSNIAQIETTGESKKDIEIYKAVVKLNDMHEEYERELREVEEKLVAVYGSAVEGMENANDNEEVNEEVIAILKKAETEAVEEVDLSERDLRFLPEAFGRIHGLVVLDLSRNQLQVIPDSIAGLQKLEELDLSSNLLEYLPDSVGFLLNLKVLNVSGNKLKSLPESIARCSSLVELDASFNNLTSLPTNFGYGLGHLERLSIQLNKIRSLPPSICEIQSLKYLDVHFNELRGLPHAIGRLTNVEVLNLSSNFSDLSELPETLGDLINLRELDLSNNQIRALPDTFHRLVNLTKLNLDQNPLEVPPMEVVREGVQAVKDYMAKRWDDMIAEEQRRILEENNQQAQSGWLTWGTSLIGNVVSGVSESVSGYLGAGKAPKDPWLDQQL